jgi:hypothetical protein
MRQGIHRWNRRVLLLVALACGSASSLLMGAQMLPVAVEELAGRAARVVHGRVEAVEMTRDTEGRILTRVELRVDATWKGEHEDKVTVVQAGGTVGTRRVVVSGEARYVPGEEVVVFLVANPRGEWLTLELAQGKFEVSRPGPGVAWVRNPFHGGEPGPDGYRPANRLPMALEGLRGRVREVAR